MPPASAPPTPAQHRALTAALTFARPLIPPLLAALPLIVWPGLPQPFSTPKLWTLTAAVILLAPLAALARRARFRAAAQSVIADGPRTGDWHTTWGVGHALVLVWLGSWTWAGLFGEVVSVEVLTLGYVTAMFAVILLEIAPRPTSVAMGMVVGATGVAGVALLQAAGLDPFALAGWVAPITGASARLRVYSTLGNPNFVAAVLVATTPLTVALLAQGGRRTGRRGVVLGGALVAQVAGAIVTGSRAGALGLVSAAVMWAVLSAGGSRRGRILVASVGCGLALLAIAVSTARPLEQTMAGRAYIWRVSWPHAWEAPFVGRGPGAFELLYPAWERRARHGHPAEFAGPQQHAHNDYLEALIERGLLGPVTILGILATCVRLGWRHPRRTQRHEASLVVGAVSMLAALAAIACVDFPLARPTELTWWWCGVALTALSLSHNSHSGVANGRRDEMGSSGPRDRPGDRDDQRGRSSRQDQVLGET